MYLQSRSSGINLGESEDAQFEQEWEQQKTKMCFEEHMLVSRTEKHQNDVKASPKLQSFNYPYSPTFLDRRIGKGFINGYENICHSGDNGFADSSGDNNGPVSDNNPYVSCEFSSDIYENDGDTFRPQSGFDRSSEILERYDDFLSDNKYQLWTENITGDTSRKEYIDMNLYRSTFQHDSSNSLQSERRIGFIENRSANTETQNLYQNEKRNDKKTNKTCPVVILGILLIACTAGVLAWFLAKKGDDEFPFKYYVAFENYKLESSIGSQVSVKCLARNTNSIKSILIRKIENSVNTTVANVTLPDKKFHVNGTTVSYTNNSLMLTFSSLTCSDDGHYTCIVIKKDGSQIESPVYLHVQIKNPPKQEAVTFILHPDIKENKYDRSNVHTCSGDVGYPSGLGYLSLKFTDPTTNASFTYDKLTVTEDMKISVEPPLKFKVSLATGLSIIIVEDNEPDVVNCTREKEIKFLLQSTSDWNKARIRCSVISEAGEVNSTSVEKQIYVIPDSVCDGSNGSDLYVPHEKIDQCRTYIRCFNNIPTGQLCGGIADICFDHQKNYCNWCTAVACESEMIPTTEEQITTIYSTPVVPEIQCPFLSCNPTSVFEMETGNFVCVLNTSMKYDNITVMKNGSAIMTVYPNGTNYYYLDNIEKYESTVGTFFTFGIKKVSCSDKDEYTFTVDVGDGGRCTKTTSLDINTKPKKPTLLVDYRWTEGSNTGTHSCIGDIGNPPGIMTLEIKNGESGNFTSFSPSTKRFSHRMENCTNNATLFFSIDLKTNNIAGHYIRCVAASYQQTSGSPFYSDEIRISPLPENTCFEDGIKPYPGECTKYISCSNNVTYVSQCGAGFCFSATTCITSNCGNICTT